MKMYGMPLALSLLLSASFIHAVCSEAKNDTKKPVNQTKDAMKTTNETPKLQYEILKPAQDPKAKSPEKGKPVTVHYTGWLGVKDEKGNFTPGAKFDSSVDRGTPFQFVIGVGMVIAGWDQGVMGMKVGEKRRLIIPSELGYGARGAGASIPPHATLIFDVELLQV